MNTYVVAAILLALGGFNKEETMEAFRTLMVTCKEQTGASDGDIAAMIKHEPAGTMEGKCMVACILKKIEAMDANGKFVKAVAMKLAEHYTQADPAKMKIAGEIIDVCKDIGVSDNHCEAAEEYTVCMKNEAIKRGIDTDQF